MGTEVDGKALIAWARKDAAPAHAGWVLGLLGTVEALDACVSWGIGYKLAVVGPMALLDMAGLDIYQAVGSYLNKELCSRGDVSPLVTARTREGRLGIKTGGGMFDYTPERIAALRQARAATLVATRKALQAGRSGA